MSTRRASNGYTLVELLLAMAIAAIVLPPLADLLRTSADSARLVRTRVDLGAEAGFALDRIAGKAAAATGTAATSDDWLKRLGFEACKSTRELLEGASCNAPDRSAVVAANVDKVELGMPDTAARTLRIALTLSHPDVPEPVVRARTVRIGGNP